MSEFITIFLIYILTIDKSLLNHLKIDRIRVNKLLNYEIKFYI